MLPDIDVIAFSFGIPYEAMLGHRGITHSFAFAVVMGLVAAKANSLGVGRWKFEVWPLWVWFAAVTASHGLLDALTNGGRGIAFFAPFSDHRYFFAWRPIQVSPNSRGIFLGARPARAGERGPLDLAALCDNCGFRPCSGARPSP